MFDCGMLPSEKFDVPVISVGNISVGGSGKTPHTEYLVSILKDKYQVAVLSRGYKRKSKGFQLAVLESRMEQIGDEPYQMKHKYPDVHVAVDADRRNGIRKLLSKEIAPPVDVVILDDAFQHQLPYPKVY
jgi:tetraacyldisaccharide 4'-kinase